MGHKCGSSCYRKQGKRSECPSCNRGNENRRLRRDFKKLKKTLHGEKLNTRHNDVRPEWIMRIINKPYDRWTEIDDKGVLRTILVGAVLGSNTWIEVVFVGSPETGEFETAYRNRQLAKKKYGRRPESWEKL